MARKLRPNCSGAIPVNCVNKLRIGWPPYMVRLDQRKIMVGLVKE